ncbi:MAG TPA: DUF885 family protein [Fimbriimonadaceae bacterium]|nr:DUF885 family protein [Fimbriimonadaceae bacterium]
MATTKPAIEADSEMRPSIERFWADEGNLERVYVVRHSPTRRNRMTEFYKATLADLKKRDFAPVGADGQVDYVLLRNYCEKHINELSNEEKDEAKYANLIPFAKEITDLEEARRRMEPVDSEKAAVALNSLDKELKELAPKIGDKLKGSKFEGNQAALAVKNLRDTLQTWFNFYNGYDPLFTWWCDAPYKAVDKELETYTGVLKEKIVGVKPDDDKAIVGNPIGRDALIDALKYEMIPYTPEELLKIADEEYAWCLTEMKKAAKELGYDDWKKALEYVKQQHVEPGKQPALIRELALEAIKFVKDRDLVTVPPLAEESWRMTMMSPEQQLVSPFFLGGETIMVSYPTNTMEQDAKMMSMRGNNRYFSRATVQHELIPGHHLQGFMMDRYKPYRQGFGTPFWIEGWALYWEMLLWDQGFPRTPEEKIGMLFWRMHRCVRIQFSIRFHLGDLTPEQCIDMLVDKVGHERANAEGEVRRSLNGSYPPLYQAAYMLGGLQFRALHHELVDSGKMTNKEFHDAILHENDIPVEMVRAILTHQKLAPDYSTTWRFRG